MNQAKRDELLKKAALILLVDWPNDSRILDNDTADDWLIGEIKQKQLSGLYNERHRMLRDIIKQFESDPEVVGENGTLLHALAVEAVTAGIEAVSRRPVHR